MQAGVLGMVMVMVSLSDGKVMVCSERNITVTKLSKVFILCPPAIANSTEIKYSLLFSGSSISHTHQKIEGSEGLFSVHFEVTANSSALYICKMTVLYPPPSVEHCQRTEVIVQEKHSLPPVNVTVPEVVDCQICLVRSPFLQVAMWVGCGVLLIYSLLITSIAIVKGRKLKKDEEDTNVYINTRPGQLTRPSKV